MTASSPHARATPPPDCVRCVGLDARPARGLLTIDASAHFVDHLSFVEPAEVAQCAAQVIKRRKQQDVMLSRFGFLRGKVHEYLDCAAQSGWDSLSPMGLPEEAAEKKERRREVLPVLVARGFSGDQVLADRDGPFRRGNRLVEPAGIA